MTGRLTRYRGRLRMAAATVLAVRVLVAASAVGLAAFVLVAWVLGPMTPVVWLCVGWAVVFGMVAAAIAWSLQPLRKLRGHGALGLVATEEPALLSPLQSAYELQTETAFSRELIVAQRLGVLRRLERSPARKFIPWHWVVQPAFAASILMAVIAWGSLGLDRASGGRYALLHAEGSLTDGVLVSHVVARTDAVLVFPDYMRRQSEHVEEADHLVVPRGTAVKYSITPIGDAARVIVELPGRHVQTDRLGELFVASFVADVEGPIEIYVESAGGERRVDYKARSIEVEADEPPVVHLAEPANDLVVESRDPVALRHVVSDDYGVQELTLIIKLPNGEHQRRALFGPPDDAQQQVQGDTTIYLEEFSLSPADAITVWLEAKDGNRIDGPGVSRSEDRTLTLASEITRRRDRIIELEKILDSLLMALAVRLEQPVEKERKAAERRHANVSTALKHTLALLFDVGEHPGPRTVPLLLDMRKRLERLQKREAAAHRNGPHRSQRARIDKSFVAELENDSILAADLISQARLNDAAAIAHEMRELQREIASLISELRRGQTPELERALMAALDRAERRMQALKQQLLGAMQYVPGEFVNQQNVQARQSSDALKDLREALAEGDLDAAEEALARLSQTIDAMTQALSQSEDSLAETRFGPRERALMEALDSIRDLEVEQQRMADRARRIGKSATRRAADEADELGSEAQQSLQEKAKQLVEQIEALAEEALGPYERNLRDRAQERLSDFERALESGDLGEALSMAEKAAQAAQGLAKDLELSAMMFRGRAGKTAEAAAEARKAAAEALDLRDATADAIPDVRGALSDREREQLQQEAARQEAAREATHQLARRLREEVGGVPVSDQTAEELESIEQPMGRASQSLDAEDPLEANKQQEAAADQLRRLRQQLESQQRSRSGRGGDDRGEGRRTDERVEIPKGRSKADEQAWRRRVLDARKGDAPEGYQPAVQDYYERLLR
ncbi:MAG: DUF4175 domain-containing protein [Myxococcales bacterium]|nr:DUF4175 domain-containing protein [Myxococcales bacterium]MDH3483597.1 DUF4175 domain-containing protein [Myxococcales bacterium]